MKYHKNIYLFQFFDFISNLQFYSLIFIMFLLSKNISLTQVGIILMVFQVSKLIFELPSGFLSDRFGRKICALVGQSVFIIFLLITILSKSFFFFILSSIFRGMGYAFLSGTVDCIFNETILKTCPNDMNRLNGINKILFYISFAFSSLLSGIIAYTNYYLVFIISIAIQAISFILLLFFEEINENSIKDNEEKQIKKSIEYLKNSKSILYLILNTSILAIVLLSYEDYYPTILKSSGMSEIFVGIATSLNFIIGAIAGLFTERIIKKFGYNFILKKIVLLIPIGFWGLFIFNEEPIISWIIYSILMCIAVVNNISSNTCIHKNLINKYRGTVISIKSLMISIVAIIISPLTGYLSDNIGFAKTFLICSILCLICLFVNNMVHKNLSFEAV